MTTSTSLNTSTSNYFNLIARGVGYAGRIRTASGGKGKSAYAYTALSVNALRGDADEPEYVRFEMEPKSAQAKAVCDWLLIQDGINSKKVLMNFECGDLSPYHFTYNGQEYDAIKARLLKVLSIKIDGELIDVDAIYHVEPSQTAIAQQEAKPNLAQHRQAA